VTAALVGDRGEVIRLAVERWHEPADAVEEAILAALPDPVLDVGCGPGRIVAALADAGRLALGVDPSPEAIARALRRRAPVVQRSVFDPLPGEGSWGSVVLLDGNVGIGGDPATLLSRCAELLRPGGRLVAEVEPPGTSSQRLRVRVESPRGTGRWFPWAQVGLDDFAHLAHTAGLIADPTPTSHAARWFAWATKPGAGAGARR